ERCAGEVAVQEVSVLVDPSASDELAARDEDGCSRRHYARGAACVTRSAVTNTAFGELVLGSRTTRPFTVIRRFPGRRMRTKERREGRSCPERELCAQAGL